MTNKEITLNVWEESDEFVHAVQGEVDSRFLTVTLKDNDGAIDLTEKTAKFLAKKPDGNVVFNEMTIENATNGIVTLELTSQLSAVPGLLKDCEIQIINSGGDTLIAKNINLCIDPSLGDTVMESLSESTVYNSMVTTVENMGTHLENVNNPHEVTIQQIGAASADVATTTTNGIMSSSDKTKLDSIESGANVNVQSDWNQTLTSSNDYIKNKPSIPCDLTDLTGTLQINKGGTGSTTVAGAQSSLKIYNDISQLNLTFPCTSGDIIDAIPAGSIVNLGFNAKSDSITDAPISYGEMCIFCPSQSRRLILCTQCISSGGDFNNFYIGYYISSDRTINWFKIPNGSVVTSIANGGTGASSANGALTSLGAAKGSDIGDVSTLLTTSKTIVGAINELHSLI